MTTLTIGNPVHLNVREVVELQAETGYPLVSIFASQESQDGAQPARRLEHLIEQADRRLALEVTPAEAQAIVGSLHSAAATVAYQDGEGAVALFASAQGARTLQLPYGVDDEVVIDDTFATRNLISALQRVPRYLVAVVAPPIVRLFEVAGERLREVITDAEVVAGAAEGGWSGGFARGVDELLDGRLADDPQPLLLLAPDAVIADFTRRSSARHFLIGSVAGDFGGSAPDRIRRVVLPQIAQQRLEADRRVLQRLVDARGLTRLAAGISGVWDVSRYGGVALLVVEESYRYPATVGDDGRLVGQKDPSAPGVLDDAVDELIETTLRHHGEVRFVADGHLSEWGRVAAIPRP